MPAGQRGQVELAVKLSHYPSAPTLAWTDEASYTRAALAHPSRRPMGHQSAPRLGVRETKEPVLAKERGIRDLYAHPVGVATTEVTCSSVKSRVVDDGAAQVRHVSVPDEAGHRNESPARNKSVMRPTWWYKVVWLRWRAPHKGVSTGNFRPAREVEGTRHLVAGNIGNHTHARWVVLRNRGVALAVEAPDTDLPTRGGREVEAHLEKGIDVYSGVGERNHSSPCGGQVYDPIGVESVTHPTLGTRKRCRPYRHGTVSPTSVEHDRGMLAVAVYRADAISAC